MSTKEALEIVAIEMIREIGLINLSRQALCEKAGVKYGSFTHIMGCNFNEFINQMNARGETGPNLPISKARAHPALRKDRILQAALAVATSLGIDKMTRAEISEQAGVSTGLITRSFGTMIALKRDVMRAAVKMELLPVIAQGLASGDRHACKAPEELKQRAANSLVQVKGA